MVFVKLITVSIWEFPVGEMMRSQKCSLTSRKSFPWLFGLYATLAILIPSQEANSTSVLSVSLADMVQKSAFVFEGKVVKIETRTADYNQMIHTYVTFEIIDMIKGSNDRKTITLSFLGGTIGGMTLKVSDMQLPKQGERGIYFVESLDRLQVHPFFGWNQGHFLVENDMTDRPHVLTNKRYPVTKVLEHAPAQAAGFSIGVARGLAISREAAIRDAISLQEFKDSLQKILGKNK